MKFIKIVDLSKMNSSQLVDASSMFENSSVEEIYLLQKIMQSILLQQKLYMLQRFF